MIAQNEKNGIHPAYIKAALEEAGTNQQEIAAELEITRSSVSLVINGKGKSRRVAELIAKKTGLSLEKMWPGTYPEQIDS